MKEILTYKKIKNKISHLIMPIAVLLLLLGVNIVADILRLGLANVFNFFIIELRINNLGYQVLGGNLISILNGASELAIIAIGMTLVTAS